VRENEISLHKWSVGTAHRRAVVLNVGRGKILVGRGG